jgi:hypothetical protein
MQRLYTSGGPRTNLKEVVPRGVLHVMEVEESPASTYIPPPSKTLLPLAAVASETDAHTVNTHLRAEALRSRDITGL